MATTLKAGKLIEAPVKNNIKDASRKETERIIDQVSTSSLLWRVIKRHKTGLLATWAVSITVWHFMPEVVRMGFDVLASVVGK